MAQGRGIAGSPDTVARFLREQMIETRCNYFVGQFAFGDLTLAEMLQSLDLFTRHFMPKLDFSIAAPDGPGVDDQVSIPRYEAIVAPGK
jgi:hypothetical protein